MEFLYCLVWYPGPKCLMDFEDKLPIYLFKVGKEFPSMGKTSWDQPGNPIDGVLSLVCILLSYVCFSRRLKLRIELILICFSLSYSFISLSLPQFFPTPFHTPSAAIYILSSVGLSWWYEGLFMLVGPFWDIFLIRWDQLLVTDVTISKLALIAKRCLVGDFPRALFTVLCRP